ncbi:MAG: tRNA 2-selenouridine(34) synthase MnmH [Pseudomonadota bacterium]
MYDFTQYDLIIDARSPREYQEDHIPRAVNLPIVNNEEYEEVGIMHKTDPHRAYQIGAVYSLQNIARYFPEYIYPLDKSAKILVYCFRGGKRSTAWFDPLKTIGYRVEKLTGGWKAYRRWVVAQLEFVSARCRFNVLCGPTNCGKTRLLTALKDVGAQVIDLEEIAKHRGSVIGALPGVSQPSQKFFESQLLDQLLNFDFSKPIWLESESQKIGIRQIPMSFFEAMHRGVCFQIDTPMTERIRVCREDYQHFEQDPVWFLDRLQHLRPLVGGKEFDEWKALADTKKMPELFCRLMETHYDPAYGRSIPKHYPQITYAKKINLPSVDIGSLQLIAGDLHFGRDVENGVKILP